MSSEKDLMAEAFDRVAHKVIDLQYIEHHAERLQLRERSRFLSEIETIVYETIGRIQTIREKQDKAVQEDST